MSKNGARTEHVVATPTKNSGELSGHRNGRTPEADQHSTEAGTLVRFTRSEEPRLNKGRAELDANRRRPASLHGDEAPGVRRFAAITAARS